jgi:hypothetical protein
MVRLRLRFLGEPVYLTAVDLPMPFIDFIEKMGSTTSEPEDANFEDFGVKQL